MLLNFLLKFLYDLFVVLIVFSCGGGVVLVEFWFWGFEKLFVGGDVEFCLLLKFWVEFGGVVVEFLFIVMSIEVVLSSCICWCFEIKSLEV